MGDDLVAIALCNLSLLEMSGITAWLVAQMQALSHHDGPVLLHHTQPSFHAQRLSLVRATCPPGSPADQLARQQHVLRGVAALLDQPAPRLMVNREVEWATGPALGSPEYRIALVRMVDANDDLARLQSIYSAASGEPAQAMTMPCLALAHFSLQQPCPPAIALGNPTTRGPVFPCLYPIVLFRGLPEQPFSRALLEVERPGARILSEWARQS